MGKSEGSAVLLLCLAVLLISSAVSGFPDEQLRKLKRARAFSRFEKIDGVAEHLDDQHFGDFVKKDDVEVGRLKKFRNVNLGEAEFDRDVRFRLPRAVPHFDEDIRDLKAEAVEEQETKNPEGVFAKVWSSLKGFTNSVGDVFPNPASLWGKQKLGTAEESLDNAYINGHRRRGHRPWIPDERELNHRSGTAGISSTEPLVLEDRRSSARGFSSKMTGIVGEVLETYYSSTVEPAEGTTCVGILEEQLEKLISSLRSAIPEQLCNDDAASLPEQKFCKLFNDHPKMATLMVFSKADVNPVTVALMRTTTTELCAPAHDDGELMDSIHQMERLGRHLPLHIIKQSLGKNHDEYEHREPHPERHHWFGRFCKHEHDHMEPDQEGHHWFGMVHKYRHERREHHRHWWHRLFRMFHKLKRMRHHEFEQGHLNEEKNWWHHEHNEMHGRDDLGTDGHADDTFGKECFSRGVHHLARDIRKQLAATCQSTTCPKLISACKFAREHKFLVKTYLAMKIRLWQMVGFHCAHTHGSLPPSFALHSENNYHIEDLDSSVAQEALLGPKLSNILSSGAQLPGLRHGCGSYHANQAFGGRLQLRGHVLGIPSFNKDENEVGGHRKFHFLVVKGHTLHPEDFQGAVVNSRPLGPGFFRDMISDLQDRLAKSAGETFSSDHGAVPDKEMDMITKPFHQHGKGSGWIHHNFRISANPQNLRWPDPKLFPLSQESDPHFKISTWPSPEQVSEINVIPSNNGSDTDGAGIADSEVELHVNTGTEKSEGRAEM